jgi:hypothetical protein
MQPQAQMQAILEVRKALKERQVLLVQRERKAKEV